MATADLKETARLTRCACGSLASPVYLKPYAAPKRAFFPPVPTKIWETLGGVAFAAILGPLVGILISPAFRPRPAKATSVAYHEILHASGARNCSIGAGGACVGGNVATPHVVGATRTESDTVVYSRSADGWTMAAYSTVTYRQGFMIAFDAHPDAAMICQKRPADGAIACVRAR